MATSRPMLATFILLLRRLPSGISGCDPGHMLSDFGVRPSISAPTARVAKKPADSLVARVTAPACLRCLRDSHCPNNGNRESGEKGKSNEIFPHGLLLSGKLRKCLERIGPKASGYFDLRGTPLNHFGDLAVYQREGLC